MQTIQPDPTGTVHSQRSRRVKIRDVVRGVVLDLDGTVPMLRGPYDLFRPQGPVILGEDGLISYVVDGEHRKGRVVASELSLSQPGDYVLVRLPANAAHEWWLYEVEAVDGDQAP